jgi:putative zinc ribbon protein
MFHDKRLPCSGCIVSIHFTGAEQRLSYELGFDPPVLCGSCRRSLEAARSTDWRNGPVRATGELLRTPIPGPALRSNLQWAASL